MKKVFITLVGVLSFTVNAVSQQCNTCDATRTMSTDPTYLKNNPDPCISGDRVNTFNWHDATSETFGVSTFNRTVRIEINC